MFLNKWNNAFSRFSRNVFKVPFNLITCLYLTTKGMKTDIKTNKGNYDLI